MAVTIKTDLIRVSGDGVEATYEISAFEATNRLSTPGATVERRRSWSGNSLQITVGWASSSSSRTLADARAQVAVMQAAVALATDLEREGRV